MRNCCISLCLLTWPRAPAPASLWSIDIAMLSLSKSEKHLKDKPQLFVASL